MTFSRQALWVVLAVFLLRLPFLTQAIQGDDPYYLKGAEHALIDPLHPSHARYVFQGDLVDMRGHPHPPLNSWMLAGLLAIWGDVREVPFHAAYIVFSLMAALSALAIAGKYTEHALLATLLFLVTPAFIVNGTSLEADLPLVAFWLAAVALTLYDRFALAALAAALAGLTAYQAIVLLPLLLVLKRQRAWLAALGAPAAIAGYMAFERLTSGALPAAVLAGYMSTYGLQTFLPKIRSAVALVGHTGWLVFPAVSALAFRREWAVGVAVGVAGAFYDANPLFWASCGVGAMAIAHCVRGWREPLCQWFLLFFAAALAIFFAGSARYLLPVALPLAVMVVERVKPRWVMAGAAMSAAVGIGLAIVNYQHWDAYREIRYQAPRVFTNAEWGLRYYLEAGGARAIEKGQAFWPGDAIVATALAAPVENGVRSVIATREVNPAIPLRIVALETKSNYSSYFGGLRPFDVSRSPIDRVTVAVVAERKAALSVLKIGTPEAAAQIVSGVFNSDRWTAEQATVLLKRPAEATVVEATVFIPGQSPARKVTLAVDGRVLVEKTFAGAGLYKLSAGVPGPAAADAVVTVGVDKTFTSPPDTRKLGVLLVEVGFR